MKKVLFWTVLYMLISSHSLTPQGTNKYSDKVIFNYEAAEKMIKWLKHMKEGADEKSLKNEFFNTVVKTEGYQTVLKHWSRFFEWNEEILYDWILHRLGKKQFDKPVIERDGNKVFFEYSVGLWRKAFSDPGAVEKDLQMLKEFNIKEQAIELARDYLPEEANLDARFYVVLFGGSGAFSVGDVNGFDLLQMMRKDDGTLFVGEIMRIFAHELHHTGFSDYFKNHGAETNKNEKLYLLSILMSEGTPTAFINNMPDALQYYTGEIGFNLRKDWKFALTHLDSLYAQIETDVISSINKGWNQEMFGRWMGGWQGPAYSVGADIMRTIGTHLGKKRIYEMFRDVRLLPETYNEAAEKAVKKGEKKYLFTKSFIRKVRDFRE